jgi:hypothetical protein
MAIVVTEIRDYLFEPQKLNESVEGYLEANSIGDFDYSTTDLTVPSNQKTFEIDIFNNGQP